MDEWKEPTKHRAPPASKYEEGYYFTTKQNANMDPAKHETSIPIILKSFFNQNPQINAILIKTYI